MASFPMKRSITLPDADDIPHKVVILWSRLPMVVYIGVVEVATEKI